MPTGVYIRKITPWNKGTKGIMKANSGSFKKGVNKGLTKETDKRVANISKALMGRKLSVSHRESISNGKKRKPSSRLGKTKENDDGVRRMAESRTGKKHFNWKGGRIRTPFGYIKCWRKGHPRQDAKGYVVEHILVMEKKIGRHLTKEEVVHHENEIKDDNRIENLRLFKNTGEHSRYHRLKESDEKHNL